MAEQVLKSMSDTQMNGTNRSLLNDGGIEDAKEWEQ